MTPAVTMPELSEQLHIALQAAKLFKAQKNIDMYARITSHMSRAANLHMASQYEPGAAKAALQHIERINNILAFTQTGGHAKVESMLNPKQAQKVIEDAAKRPSMLSERTFDDLDILPALKKAIKATYPFSTMTKTQNECIPHVLKGEDIFVQASTGTGKTLAFLIPALHIVLSQPSYKDRNFDIVILHHTQVLAKQTLEHVENIAAELEKQNITILVGKAIGGENTNVRDIATRGANVLLATPNRLIQYLKDPTFAIRFSKTKIFVMDEGDQLIDGGFRFSTLDIARMLPKAHQTLMFSATLNNDSVKVLKQLLKEPYQHLVIESPLLTVHTYACVKPDRVFAALLNAIDQEIARDPQHRIVVFFPSKNFADLAYELLKLSRAAYAPNVMVMHGGVSDSQRKHNMDSYRRSGGKTVLASDMLARGVDYPDITLVIQVGASREVLDYMQRTGRTGRAGKPGIALSLLCDDESGFLAKIIVELQKKDKVIEDVTKKIDVACPAIDRIRILIAQDERLQTMVKKAWKSTSGAYKSYGVFKKSDDALYDGMNARFGTAALGLPASKIPNRVEMAESMMKKNKFHRR